MIEKNQTGEESCKLECHTVQFVVCCCGNVTVYYQVWLFREAEKECIWKMRESSFFKLEIVCREEITSAGNGTDSGLGVRVVKACRKGGGITPLILNVGCPWKVCGQPHVTASYTWGKSPCYRFSRRLICSPGSVWTFWRRGKSVALAGIGTPDHLARILVTLLTTLTLFL
jgi:hypothetical protein